MKHSTEDWRGLEERIGRAVRETGLSYFRSPPASGELSALRVQILDSVLQGRRTVYRCRVSVPAGGGSLYSEEMLFEVQDGFLRRVGEFC